MAASEASGQWARETQLRGRHVPRGRRGHEGTRGRRATQTKKTSRDNQETIDDLLKTDRNNGQMWEDSVNWTSFGIHVEFFNLSFGFDVSCFSGDLTA